MRHEIEAFVQVFLTICSIGNLFSLFKPYRKRKHLLLRKILAGNYFSLEEVKNVRQYCTCNTNISTKFLGWPPKKNVDTYCQNIEMMARDLSYSLTDLYVESSMRLWYELHYRIIQQYIKNANSQNPFSQQSQVQNQRYQNVQKNQFCRPQFRKTKISVSLENKIVKTIRKYQNQLISGIFSKQL